MTHASSTTIPLDEASAMLRNLSLTLLRSVLQCQPSPQLSRLLTARQITIMLPYGRSQLGIPFGRATLWPWMRQTLWRMTQPARRQWSPPDLRATLGRAVHRGIRRKNGAAHWQRLSALWVDRQIGGVSARWLADPFWELAAAQAWHDANFQNEVSRLMLQTLRKRVLFTPNEMPIPTLSPNTCWALIAMAERGPLPLQRRWTTNWGIARLQRLASAALLTPGWADVWEQWVIGEALRLWPNAVKQMERDALAAVVALPLPHLLYKPNKPPVPTTATLVNLAAPGWETRTPSWLHTLAFWEAPTPDAAAPA